MKATNFIKEQPSNVCSLQKNFSYLCDSAMDTSKVSPSKVNNYLTQKLFSLGRFDVQQYCRLENFLQSCAMLLFCNFHRFADIRGKTE